MKEPTVTLVIGFEGEHRQAIVDVPRTSRDSLRLIVEHAIRNFGRGFLPAGWGVRLDGNWLPMHKTLAEAIADLDRHDKLVLTIAKLPAGETSTEVEDIPLLGPEDIIPEAPKSPEGIQIGPTEELFLDRPSVPPSRQTPVEEIDLKLDLPAPSPESSGLDLGPPAMSDSSSEFELSLDDDSPFEPPAPAAPPAPVTSPAVVEEAAAESNFDLVGEALEEDADFAAALTDEEEDERPRPAPAARAKGRVSRLPPQVDRHATVRYYSQMNPQRVYPLLVVLSKKEIQKVRKRHVNQAASGPMRVDTRVPLEVEPVLPGFACHPHREVLEITDDEAVTLTFFVVPQVLGNVEGAKVLLRQGGKVLTRLPLEIRVVNTTLTLVMGLATLLLPFGTSLLRHFKLDFESQLQEGFVSYGGLLRWLLQNLSPEVMALGLLACTGGVFLWLRPRQRDVFWDLEDPAPEPPGKGVLAAALRYGGAVALIGAAAGAVLAGGILVLAGTQSGWEQAVRGTVTLLWALPLGGLVCGGLLGLIGGFFFADRD